MMATLPELYARYGELTIKLEIVQNKIIAVKKEIAAELAKPKDSKEIKS